MKARVGSNWVIVLTVISLLFFVGVETAHAAWTEPVSITGLNDPNWHGGGYPGISSDGRSIYFTRKVSPGGLDGLFEATRDNANGHFTAESHLAQLTVRNQAPHGAWISRDGLRMYYWQTIKENGQWGSFNVIKMAARQSAAHPWEEIRTLSELHIPETADKRPTLTGDELTIMWASDRVGGRGNVSIYSATRSSIGEPFSNIVKMPELTALKVEKPHLSGDGLRVYFHLWMEGGGGGNIYVGSRASLADVFGDFRLMEGVTGPDAPGSNPYLTPDERTIYFNSGRGGIGGIWVSHRILRPRVVAVESLEDAIRDKRAAIDRITAAIKHEVRALMALHKIVMNPDGERLTRSDIYKARTQIMLSLRRQIKARTELYKAIENLREAIGYIKPDRTHPPEPGTGDEPVADEPRRIRRDRR